LINFKVNAIMQRIKIEEPPFYPFSTCIAVRITDLNYGNHVGNDAFLSLVHEARVQFLQWLGYRELDVEGYGLIMADAAINFRLELKYGDQVTIQVGVAGLSAVGFDLVYKMTTVRNSEIKVAGLVKTGMVLLDPNTRRPVNLPFILRGKLTAS
jgi:acyl-CoA thioester hydrolase